MKKLLASRILLMILLLITTSLFFINCSSSKSADGTLDKKKLAQWYDRKEWLNGLQLTPHKTINQQEFSKQYHKNRVWWDKAFEFLKTNDLINLQPGSYIIDTGNVIATVSELPARDMDKVNWEAHRNFNDLQYIIKGKVQMGVVPITDISAKVAVPYDSKGDNETFSVLNGKYYDGEPGTFFIFSPQDIHRPAFKVTGYDVVKKIVIKVRVPQII